MSKGVTPLEKGLQGLGGGGEAFDFSINWDPNNGAGPNQGRLDITIGGVSDFLDDIPTTNTGLSFDAFGIFGQPCCGARATTIGQIAIDSVTYSVVPEPSSILLLTLGGLALAALAIRRNY